MCSNEVMQWIDEPWPHSQAKQFFCKVLSRNKRKGADKQWLVTEKQQALPLGLIGLNVKDPVRGISEIGIVLDPSSSSLFKAPIEITKTMLDFAHKNLQQTKVVCKIKKDNAATIKLAKHTGFVATRDSKQWFEGEVNFAE